MPTLEIMSMRLTRTSQRASERGLKTKIKSRLCNRSQKDKKKKKKHLARHTDTGHSMLVKSEKTLLFADNSRLFLFDCWHLPKSQESE